MSTRESFVVSAVSRLVSSASAVSRLVRHVTPVSTAWRLMINPSLLLSTPCDGVSMIRSISWLSIRSSRFGDGSSTLLMSFAGTPFSLRTQHVLLVEYISYPRAANLLPIFIASILSESLTVRIIFLVFGRLIPAPRNAL